MSLSLEWGLRVSISNQFLSDTYVAGPQSLATRVSPTGIHRHTLRKSNSIGMLSTTNHAGRLPQVCLVQPACRAAGEACTRAGTHAGKGKVLKHPSATFWSLLHLLFSHHPISVWLVHVTAATYEAGGFMFSIL